MGSFIYLYRKILGNRIKKALKKPVTYIFAVFAGGYIALLIMSFGAMIVEHHINTPQNLAVLLSILIFFLLPGNLISYARRKGLLFQQSDVHFVFPAPVNPKHVILFAGMKNLVANVFLSIFIGIMALLFFDTGVLVTLGYVAAFLVFESVLEVSMMILCYGNEKLPEKFFKVLTVICYALMAVFVLVAVAMLVAQGPSFSVIQEYLSLPVIQLIPVIGWNIAMTRLFFVGPTVLNIICTLLFCVSSIVLFILACRVKCVGEYYEDAAKFADDYEELRTKKKKGENAVVIGKKKKFKAAQVEYKGSFAKAIFYRQLLEYKKSRVFIFSINTLINLAIGIGIAVLAVVTDMVEEAGVSCIYIIPGIMAYLVFIFSTTATKWTRELENPYTYLIPDSSFKKMWYATAWEHIRALVDGILITLPGAIFMKLTPLQTILIIVLYVCLMANKLYCFMLADVIIGKVLGTLGRSVVKMVFQGLILGIAVIAAVVGGQLFNVEVGFIIMIVVVLVLTFFSVLGASTAFEKMEAMD